MDKDVATFYILGYGGMAFCSLVLFIVPTLKYDFLPIWLGFELWIATIVTSASVWSVMYGLQSRLADRLDRTFL